MRLCWLALIVFAQGCGTTLESYSQLQGTDTNFGQSELISRAFSGNAVSSRFSSAQTTPITVQVTSASRANVTIDGTDYSLFNFDGKTFESGASQETLTLGTRLKDAPVTPDVLYLVLTDTPPPSLGGPQLHFLVDGTTTSAARLPNRAVRYQGATAMFGGGLTTANGQISMDVDFRTGQFDASITNSDPFDASTVFDVTGGTETDGRLNGQITGPNVTDGSLSGAIYGPAGDQAAGTLLIKRSGTDLIGTFGAID